VSYKLYGVLVHLGHTSHSGHYYSYVRGPNEQWYRADDTRVSGVQQTDALGQNAYILFYSKIQNTDHTSDHSTSPVNNSIPKNNSTTLNNVNGVLNKPKPQNIPNIIFSSSPAVSSSTSNYLNSLNKTNINNNNNRSTVLDSNHQKIVIKFNSNNNSNDLGVKLSKKEEIDVKKSENKEKEARKEKKLSKIKKLKRLIKRLNTQLEDLDKLTDEETQMIHIKLRMKKKKLKKLKKAKKESKKSKLKQQENDEHSSSSKKRKLENDDLHKDGTTLSKKKSLVDVKDGLSLLRQVYCDVKSTPSPPRTSPQLKTTTTQSPAASPTHSHTSLSSMSSATSISLNLKDSSDDYLAAKNVQIDESDSVFKYNSSSKLPTKINGNDELSSMSAPSSHSIFDQIKEKSSLTQVKTWSNEKSYIVSKDSKSREDYDEDMDEYNQEFDKPRVKTSKLKKNGLAHNAQYSGFHMYTHGASGGSNKNPNYHGHNHKHDRNHFNKHQNHHQHKSHNHHHNHKHKHGHHNYYHVKNKPFNPFHKR
jgi:hypothetical protein